MFRCPITRKLTRPREKQFKIVLETRPKVYTKLMKDGTTEKVIGKGWEIVKELCVSEEGYLKVKNGEF